MSCPSSMVNTHNTGSCNVVIGNHFKGLQPTLGLFNIKNYDSKLQNVHPKINNFQVFVALFIVGTV